MKRGKQIYTDGEKTFYEVLRNNGRKVIPNIIEVEANNQSTNTNEERRDIISAKQYVNNLMSTLLFKELEKQGLSTYYLRQGSTSTSKIVKKFEAIPLEVIGRKCSERSPCDREEIKLEHLMVKLIYNGNKGHKEPISSEFAENTGIANMITLINIYDNMEIIYEIASNFFSKLGLTLIDFKAEFGFESKTGKLILTNDLNMDTCHLQDEGGKTLYEQIFCNGSPYNVNYDRIVHILKEYKVSK